MPRKKKQEKKKKQPASRKSKTTTTKQNVHVNVQSSGGSGGGGSAIPAPFAQKNYGENVRIENLLSELSKHIISKKNEVPIQKYEEPVQKKDIGTSPIDVHEDKNNKSILEQIREYKPQRRMIDKELARGGGSYEEARQRLIDAKNKGENIYNQLKDVSDMDAARAGEFAKRSQEQIFYNEEQVNEPLTGTGIEYIDLPEYNSPFGR